MPYVSLEKLYIQHLELSIVHLDFFIICFSDIPASAFIFISNSALSSFGIKSIPIFGNKLRLPTNIPITKRKVKILNLNISFKTQTYIFSSPTKNGSVTL